MRGPCPWEGYRPANLTFCEADVCGLVTQPANTWSNVGFVVVGIAIVVLARREGAHRALLLGPIALATGVGSAAFHATSTLVGQLVDQSAMFLESSAFVVWNLARLRPMPRSVTLASYALLTAVSVALLLRFETLGIVLFVAHVVAFLAIELLLFLRRERPPSYGPLLGVGATFVTSYALWWLDRLRIVCNPQNHVFTLHGAWHLLGAASFYFWYRHYAQLERNGTRGAR